MNEPIVRLKTRASRIALVAGIAVGIVGLGFTTIEGKGPPVAHAQDQTPVGYCVPLGDGRDQYTLAAPPAVTATYDQGSAAYSGIRAQCAEGIDTLAPAYGKSRPTR